MPAAERSLCNDPLVVAGVQCERSWPSSGELGHELGAILLERMWLANGPKTLLRQCFILSSEHTIQSAISGQFPTDYRGGAIVLAYEFGITRARS